MRAAILVGFFVIGFGALADEKPLIAPAGEMRATLAVKVDPKQIVGVPIIFELTITNSGNKAFAYWCGGPEKYPPADWFEAVIVDDAGKERRVRMSNGQYHMGSGGDIKIEPGKAAKLPAAIEGLPAGKYTIKGIAGEAQGYFPNPKLGMVMTSPAMEWKEGQKFEVKNDANAADRFAKELLKQVRAGQAFAKHVATAYTVQVVIDAMFRDLESADPEVVAQASKTIHYGLDEFPKGLGAVIRRAMSKQLSVESPSGDTTALLASLAQREGSDDSLEAVLAYIDSGMQREWSMQNLFQFKQEKAARRLREILKAEEWPIRLRAATGLSQRRDPAAIPVLLEAARKGNTYREEVFAPLSEYWDDERAMALLREAAADADESVRRRAAMALKSAEGEREYARKQAGKK